MAVCPGSSLLAGDDSKLAGSLFLPLTKIETKMKAHSALLVTGGCIPSQKYLISSPYYDFGNQLDLHSLDGQSRLFALALTNLRSIIDGYATAPYMDSFNWPDVFSVLKSMCLDVGLDWQRHEFYAVIFRSRLRKGADRVRLGELDQRSHEEACASGGLLKYWFGTPDRDGKKLATCTNASIV